MASQGGTSRLAQMQMRFQQKQQQEREQRKIEMTGGRTISETTETKSLSSTMGTGKVRQMFDERRQRGTGIDKSYPLKPIASRTSSGPTTTVTTTKAVESTVRRKTAVLKQTNSRTSTSETALVNKKTNVLNGNVVIPNKGNISARATGDPGALSNHNAELPKIEKLSLDNNKNLNGFESGDKNNNSKSNNRTVNNTGIKLKPVVTKKVAPEPKLQKQESNLSSSSSRLLSPASDKSTPTRASTKTNAKPTNTSSQIMAAAAQKSPSSNPMDNMAACRICGRHFNVDRLQKHQQICERTAAKKRKVFDASKHRVKGTEAEQYIRRAIKTSAPKPAPAKVSPEVAKKSNWRKKHEEFIQAIRAAKEVQAHLAKGGKLSDLPPPPPSENPDYVQCPHCKRRFNEAAAARHIPKCADMLHNKPKPGAPSRRGR